MLSRIKFDIQDLFKEMLDQIPEEVFNSKNTTFVDVEAAGGQSYQAIKNKLLAAGHSKEDVKKRVTMFFNNAFEQNYAINKNSVDCNTEVRDILKNPSAKKFDVVIGNPPYQDINSVSVDRIQPKNHNLWTKFIHQSFEFLVKDNGYVSFVTPDSWMSPSNDVFQLFKKYQVHTVNLDCNKYFNVGSSFTHWVAQKTPVTKETNFGNVSVNLKSIPYLPRHIDDTLDIHKKVIMNNYQTIQVSNDTSCHSSKEHVVKDKDNVNKYLLHHTNAQTRFSPIKSKYFNNKKVYWTYSGYFIPRKDFKGAIGITEAAGCVIANNDKEVDALFSMLNSKLYKFIIETGKWSGFINGKVVAGLPMLPMKIWTDKTIYKHFNLTKKEIDIVESYVK